MHKDFSRELDIAKHLARDAGRMLLEHRERRMKADAVDSIERKVDTYLTAQLSYRFSEHGIITKQVDDGSRFHNRFVWVVDALNGREAYQTGEKNFSIVIGLMENAFPCLGVVYQPVGTERADDDELTSAVKGLGAIMEVGRRPYRLQVNTSSDVNLVVTKRKNQELQDMILVVKPDTITYMGSLLKVVHVANGEQTESTLYLCPRSVRTHLVDLCALDIILREAGGTMTDVYGKYHHYGQKNLWNDDGIVASNGILHADIIRKLKKTI